MKTVKNGLSVLIPVYNWDSSALIEGLHAQGMALGVDFELVVADDCSTDLNLRDKVASSAAALEKCLYLASDHNLGRAAIRNFLAEKASFNKLLFIDCDAGLASDGFLSAYLDSSTKVQVVCGGLKHPSSLPQPGMELRYRYEKAADRYRTAKYRSRNPYDRFTPFSFLIDRDVFMGIRFDEAISGYGYEDVEFGVSLQALGVSILHIDNPLIHLGLDDNRTYLKKTASAISNLYENRSAMAQGSHLLNVYYRLERLHLIPLVRFSGHMLASFMRRNLTGRHPSLKLFSFYKLQYLAFLFRNGK